MFCNQHQRLHCRLPFIGIVRRLRQFGDVERGVAERDQFAPVLVARLDRKIADPTTS